MKSPEPERDIPEVPEERAGEGEAGQETGRQRPNWTNKLEYLLAQLGFSVGLGNIWRFPYMCEKNGGGAYLFPYIILLLVIGMPLFFLELAVGQRIRRGSIGAWYYINPRLSGIGFSSIVVVFFIAMYYNVIIAWSLFYISQSFQSRLPWVECPLIQNTSCKNNCTDMVVPECANSSPTTYFWYRKALNISDSITDSGELNWKITLCLLATWTIVCLCMMKGIKSTGKVLYFFSIFPYVVLICFLIRALLFEGAEYGVVYLFTPKLEDMLKVEVWIDAAIQVFFAQGLGMGGVIAYSSYNKQDNNCHFDAVLIPFLNLGTSILATLVVFAVLGFDANVRTTKCVELNTQKISGYINSNIISPSIIPPQISLNQVSINDYQQLTKVIQSVMTSNYSSLGLDKCYINEELTKEVGGTGLAFIKFTQAMGYFPAAPVWSFLFFLMLLCLGLGTMFGVLEGIVTPLADTFKVRKVFLTVGCCLLAFYLGLIFVQRSGSYYVDMFDSYSATLPLVYIVFLENLSVSWVYGSDRFFEDLKNMLGFSPYRYYYYMWKFVTPLLLLMLLVSSIVKMSINPPGYRAWIQNLAQEKFMTYPPWGIALCILLIVLAILPVPVIFIYRYFKKEKIVPQNNDCSVPSLVSVYSEFSNLPEITTSKSGSKTGTVRFQV